MNRFLSQALSAIGILVFAVGFPIAPLLSVSLTYGWGQTSISWVVALSIMAAWLWLGTRFVIRPREPRYIIRIVASAIVFVAFLFVHPWIFGLSGRVGELRLEHSLRPGMTIAQATGLIQKIGGDPLVESPKILTVQFVDFSTFCVGGGLRYTLTFGENQTLKSWDSKEWSDAC